MRKEPFTFDDFLICLQMLLLAVLAGGLVMAVVTQELFWIGLSGLVLGMIYLNGAVIERRDRP